MNRTTKNIQGTIIALDVGAARIGVAVARQHTLQMLGAQPLTTLEHTGDVVGQLARLIADEQAAAIVVGLPRGLSGQATEQTKATEDFAQQLITQLNIPLYWQDEAVTSKQAEAELQARGKPYNKGDIDALAACYILNDFINSQEPIHE